MRNLWQNYNSDIACKEYKHNNFDDKFKQFIDKTVEDIDKS